MSRLYRNEDPFGAWQAICLLYRSWGDCTRRTLNTFPREAYCIDVGYFTGPYDSWSSCARFQVTSDAVDYLKQHHLVIGEPYWGGRSTFKFLPTEQLALEYHNTIAPRFEARTWGRS
jgi:hypothetical protein